MEIVTAGFSALVIFSLLAVDVWWVVRGSRGLKACQADLATLYQNIGALQETVAGFRSELDEHMRAQKEWEAREDELIKATEPEREHAEQALKRYYDELSAWCSYDMSKAMGAAKYGQDENE